MCPHSKMKREKGNMEFSLFKKVIDQVKDYVEVVDLDLYGEFTFNPDWREMISYAKSRGLFTVLNTNATLFDDEIIEGLCESELDFLSISFDGASANVYEKIRVGAKYEKTMENINRFIENNHSIFSVIQIIHTTETENEIEEFRNKWKKSGFDAVRVKEYIPFDPQKGELDPHNKKKDKTRPGACLFLWKNIVVCQDGAVVPCCVDYDKIYVLGDANTQSIEEVWNGKPMRHIREKHARGEFRDIKLCKHCRPFTSNPILILLGAFIDDAMRRKIMPMIEEIQRYGVINVFK